MTLTSTDDMIVRLLGESRPPPEILSVPRLRMTPANIAENLGKNNDYVQKRCKHLVSEGLLQRHQTGGDPYYSLSDMGDLYLASDVDDPAQLDIDDLEKP